MRTGVCGWSCRRVVIGRAEFLKEEGLDKVRKKGLQSGEVV